MFKKLKNRVVILAIISGISGIVSALGYNFLSPEQQQTLANFLVAVIGFFA